MVSAMAEFQSRDETSINRIDQSVVRTLEWIGDGTQAESVKGHIVKNVKGHIVKNVRGHNRKNVKGHRVKNVHGHKVNQTYRHTIKLSDWLKMMRWDMEEKDEEKRRTMVSSWGAKTVKVEKKGGKFEYFVVMLTLGPNASNTQYKPRDPSPRRESKEDPESRLSEELEGTKVCSNIIIEIKSSNTMECFRESPRRTQRVDRLRNWKEPR